MRSLSQVMTLVRKEFLLEWRQQYAFYGILLYVTSTVFVMYIAIRQPEAKIWNALFWVIQLFITVNTVAKSFLQESPGRMLYFYTLVGATEFVAAKLIYNVLLMLLMSGLSLLLYMMWLGNPLINIPFFIGMVCLGGAGLALTFTMLAAISAKAGQNAALMAIMGFPLVIIQVMILVNATQSAFLSVYQPGLTRMIVLLAGMDVLVVALSVILFPFLWKN
ncbi:cytochrome C biogenesis protein [Compostibacter hankyongensis]|uniref:Heme exporter protein CcmB n=1 Tax=Compostibacter hankyongensis TaxID=1007089 RepID=A0ABP8FHU2_9BACT